MAVPPEKVLELSEYPFTLRRALTPRNQTARALREAERTFRVRFPELDGKQVAQDQEWMEVTTRRANGARLSEFIRFHEYDRIYRIPGLYEHVFHRRLKCRSPEIISNLLMDAYEECKPEGPLRLLDIGAGSGLISEALSSYLSFDHIVGVDIIKEARYAAERDRPGLYNEYMVADLTKLNALQQLRLSRYEPNMMCCVAALGFGDIPVKAFKTAFNFVQKDGLIAFTIKDDFLSDDDQSGFARFIKHLEHGGYMQVLCREQFLHRYSMNGEKIFYYGIIAKKEKNYE